MHHTGNDLFLQYLFRWHSSPIYVHNWQEEGADCRCAVLMAVGPGNYMPFSFEGRALVGLYMYLCVAKKLLQTSLLQVHVCNLCSV